MGGVKEKHYVTIFMMGRKTKDSSELENLEPHKCVGWKWISIEELISIYRETPELLFDPMIHFIENVLKDPKILDTLFS